MAADVGNAYLTSKTKEKVYIIAGPEFGELEGYTLLIDKALYGLCTSGAHFHDKLFDTLAAEGWKPCLLIQMSGSKTVVTTISTYASM